MKHIFYSYSNMRNLYLYKIIVPLSTVILPFSFSSSPLSPSFIHTNARTSTTSNYRIDNINSITTKPKQKSSLSINNHCFTKYKSCNKLFSTAKTTFYSNHSYHTTSKTSFYNNEDEHEQLQNLAQNNNVTNTTNFSLSKRIIQNLSNKSKKTWNRLYPMIQLSSLANNTTKIKQTAIDIGCDHGLLTLGVATSLNHKYNKIIGIDASYNALLSGGVYNYNKCNETYPINLLIENLNVDIDFRVGNGLFIDNNTYSMLNKDILDSEYYNSIFISGMGINTIIDILFPTYSNNTTTINQLDNVKCNELYLQPASPKPTFFIQLYDILYEHNWIVSNEIIQKVGKRYYISSSFTRCCSEQPHDTNEKMLMPGTYLALNYLNNGNNDYYYEYVIFHKKWIENDKKIKGCYGDYELRWLHSDPVQSIGNK